MSEPREFWIYPGVEAWQRDEVIMNPACKKEHHWHVIEYAAYDALTKERDGLKVTLSVAIEALVWCDEMLTARDEMNSKVHCAPVRLSPITERVKQAIAAFKKERGEG